jgi:hypothetical protein
MLHIPPENQWLKPLLLQVNPMLASTKFVNDLLATGFFDHLEIGSDDEVDHIPLYSRRVPLQSLPVGK